MWDVVRLLQTFQTVNGRFGFITAGSQNRFALEICHDERGFDKGDGWDRNNEKRKEIGNTQEYSGDHRVMVKDGSKREFRGIRQKMLLKRAYEKMLTSNVMATTAFDKNNSRYRCAQHQ